MKSRIFIIAIVVLLSVSCKQEKEDILPAKYVEKVDSTPDLMQTDPALGLLEGGVLSCGSVSATNGFAWLADNGFENIVLRNEDGSVSYAKTAQAMDRVLHLATMRGALPPSFLRGVARYLSEQGYTDEDYRLEFQGWLHSGGFEGISIPNIDAIKKGTVGDGAVWLFVGFYQFDEQKDEYQIISHLNVIAPGSSLAAIHPLAGSFSNFTHLVEFDSASGQRTRIVVRRYAVFGEYDRGEKARREFKTLELLRKNDIPVPQPLYLDERGTLLGTPGIVTSYVPGQLIMQPADPLTWARSLAVMLARIHSIACGAAAKDFLLDANLEATWFLRSGVVPDYMNAHPDGAVVWQAVHDLWLNRQATQATLVHIDYWSGNILWEQGRITAIVDWEEAACGDAGIDVAYCRMDMVLGGLDQAADEFLAVYEANMGRPVANLGLWELAAAARPMFSPEGWITGSPAKERFSQFIADARKRAN